MELKTEKRTPTERILAAAAIAATAIAAFAVAWFNPVTAGFFPKCPLMQMTGLACPGCGLTRGYHALFHGDVLTALDFNGLIPLYSIFFLYLLATGISVAVRGRAIDFGTLPQKAVWAFLFIGLGFAVLRNLPFYPLNILYP